MSRVIFDIETIGQDFDSFDEKQREYLLRYAESAEDEERTKEMLGLWAPTGEVAAIGLLNPDTDQGRVYYRGDGDDEEARPIEEGGIRYLSGTERELLTEFWKDIASYKQVITFNGRGFDAPFLMLRSAILGVRVSKNLLPPRYSPEHIDLLEQFTFYGATRKFNLHFYARVFGIQSPKDQGITGLDVAPLFKEGKRIEIARYCMGDVRATKELFIRWESFIRRAA